MSDEPCADTRDMYVVHNTFRREFALMPGLVRGVAAGDTGRAQVVADHVVFLVHVLHHHHEAEDAHLWPKLLDRAPRDTAPLVHRMESHHQGIAAALDEVGAGVDSWRADADAGTGAALADALDRLVGLLGEHLTAEETEVLPLAERHITAAEWSAMVTDGGAQVKPEYMPVLFGMGMYEGDPEIIDEMVSHMPAELQPVIRQVGRDAFGEYSLRVHGTATPPRLADV